MGITKDAFNATSILSGTAAGMGALSLLSLGTAGGMNMGLLSSVTFLGIFASPAISAALVVPAAFGALNKQRGPVARAFSTAAAGIGVLGPVALGAAQGPEALGMFFVSTLTMTLAGALNVGAELTKNIAAPQKPSGPQ